MNGDGTARGVRNGVGVALGLGGVVALHAATLFGGHGQLRVWECYQFIEWGGLLRGDHLRDFAATAAPFGCLALSVLCYAIGGLSRRPLRLMLAGGLICALAMALMLRWNDQSSVFRSALSMTPSMLFLLASVGVVSPWTHLVSRWRANFSKTPE